MSILSSYFNKRAEKKVIDKTTTLYGLQIENFNRFNLCKNKNDWRGASCDARIILEGVSIIEHLITLHKQNTQSPSKGVDHSSAFFIYELELHNLLVVIIDEIVMALITHRPFYSIFVEQMRRETSEWKTRMVWVVSRDHKELGELVNEVLLEES